MNVKVYYRGLRWYSARLKGDTLVYSPGKEEDPEYPNIYLLMKDGVREKVSKALNMEPENVLVL